MEAKMFGRQLSILFLIFYVQNSSCSIEDTLTLVNRTRIMIKLINKINTTRSAGIEFDKLLVDPNHGNDLAQEFYSIYNELRVPTYSEFGGGTALREFLGLTNGTAMDQRQRDIHLSMSAIDQQWMLFSNFVANSRGYHLSYGNSYRGSKPILYAPKWHRNITEEHLNKIRQLVIPIDNNSPRNYGLFGSVTASAINARNDTCDVEVIAVRSRNFYKLLMFHEMRALLFSAVAQGYENARIGVAQPETADISIDFDRQLIKYTRALSASLKAVESSISENCILKYRPRSHGPSILSDFGIDASE